MATSPAARPLTSTAARRLPASYLVWFGLVAYLGLVKLLVENAFPGAFADPAQAGPFAWPALAVFGGLGLAGVWLSRRTGFPEAWDARLGPARQVLLPVLAGIALGGVMVAADLLTGFTAIQKAARGVPQQWTGYAPMFLIFSAAPIILEVIFRLALIPLGLWLVSGLLLKGRGQPATFWVLAALTSALEPFMMTPDLQVLPGALWAGVAALQFATNFTQAAFFRRYGFLAAILVRVGFYLVWHVVYIH
jgi:hypothetical protein